MYLGFKFTLESLHVVCIVPPPSMAGFDSFFNGMELFDRKVAPAVTDCPGIGEL